MQTENDKYTLDINFSATYDDKGGEANVSIRDSDGLDVSTRKVLDDSKPNAIDDMLTDLFDEAVDLLINKPAPKSLEEQLQDKVNSLAIDNKILQERLNKLQAAYDTKVKELDKSKAEKGKCSCQKSKNAHASSRQVKYPKTDEEMANLLDRYYKIFRAY